MNIENTSNAAAFKEAAGKKWFLSVKPASPKQTLAVKFEEGKAYKFIGTGIVNIGDPVIIDYGGASSYKMGTVKGIEKGITIKRTHALKPLFTFTTDPDKSAIKKNTTFIKELTEIEDVDSYFDDFSLDEDADKFHVIDHLVGGVLNAISVVAFPNLAGAAAVDKAKLFLAAEKPVPGFVFGQKFSDRFFAASSGIPYHADSAENSFTGFYPGWKEDLLNCDVWKSGDLSNVKMTWDSREQAYYLYYLDGSETMENLFNSNDGFKKMTNELVFRSALSILIRGGFVNLLEAALSVEMPIKGFYEKLRGFAKEIGSNESYDLLEKTDYVNKTFTKSTKPTPAPKETAASKDFVIKDGVLTKYKGKDEKVIIPDGVKTIGESAFDGYKDLKKVIMPDSVTSIKSAAFRYCRNLEEIVFSKKLTSIAPLAFCSASGLKSVDLSNTKVKSIRKKCFTFCEKLENVALPNSLKSIEEYAFNKTAIKELHFPATIETISSLAFGDEFNEAFFAGTNQVEFNSSVLTSGGKNGKIHCIKGSDLWKMFESQREKAEAWNKEVEKYSGMGKHVILDLVEL